MTNEEKAKAYVAALAERDQRWNELQKAQAKFDEAQSRAFELELQLFEPAAEPVRVQLRGFTKTIGARVLDAFEKPRRLREVVAELGLSRQQVQTAVNRHLSKGRLTRRGRGMYVALITTKYLMKKDV